MSGVSVVATVLNEGASIEELLASLAGQTCPPGEVVIVDGGSSDDTLSRLQAWQDRLPLSILVRHGANISQGRNAAIAAAQNELIAVTDAGVRLPSTWLARLTAPFEATDSPDVVSGFFHADPRSTFELAMGATVLPSSSEIDPARFLPSSRSVAFRKAAWKDVGGYPEWLDYCEDLVIDLRLKEKGYRFAWAPEAAVSFRPRGNLKAFFRQYYLYARGDGKAGLWPRRHLARYGAYAALCAVTLSPQRSTLAVAGLLGAGAFYLRRPYVRLFPHLAELAPLQRAVAIALVPVIRVVGDCAKMLGYPVGLIWRLRHRRASPER